MGWLYGLAFVIGPALVGLLAQMTGENGASREEYEMDRRRVQGGYAYNDLVWEIKGEEERSVGRLLDLLRLVAEKEPREVLATEIAARYRQLERLHRLLNHRERE